MPIDRFPRRLKKLSFLRCSYLFIPWLKCA